MITSPEKETLERVPRADKLNLLRDILHLLSEMGGVSGKKRLLNETIKRLTAPELDYWVASTLEDYLNMGDFLKLVNNQKNIAAITEKGFEFIKITKFGEPNLESGEKNFLRPLFLDYPPFRTYVSRGFLRGEPFSTEDQLDHKYQNSECPTRKELIESYMLFKGHKTDREARTLLRWSEQIDLVEFDGYSGKYYLVKKEIMNQDSFLKHLIEVYFEIRDSREKVALIPELRTRFCCLMKIKREVFDATLLELYEKMPSKIHLGKASSSRSIVKKFGIHGKTFYYFYIKIAGEMPEK